MRKTGSVLIIEMVGPAGSTSEGAFSCAISGDEDEVCSSLGALAELLVGWANDVAGERQAKMQKTATIRTAKDGNALNVM
jgi:hypothetical protein